MCQCKIATLLVLRALDVGDHVIINLLASHTYDDDDIDSSKKMMMINMNNNNKLISLIII